MKKLSLIVFLLSIVILSWCGRNNQDNNSDYLNNVVSGTDKTFINITKNTWEVDKNIEKDTSATFTDTKKIARCIPEELSKVKILNIDDIVKNCKEETKQWLFLDWLGWLCKVYDIYNNQLVEMVRNNDDNPNAEIVCEKEDGYLLKQQQTNDAWTPGLSLFTKVIGKWLIDNVASRCDPDNIYCESNDVDCSSMIDYGWVKEWKNYFLASLRKDSTETRQVFYVINDKLYNPWMSDRFSIMKNSKRNFAWFTDNKAIVKRIKWWKIKWDPNFDDPNLDLTTVKSTFTLETCEIDL